MVGIGSFAQIKIMELLYNELSTNGWSMGIKKRLRLWVGWYKPRRVNCIQMDTNQAYGTNGTIHIIDVGWIEYAYDNRSRGND